MTQVKKPRKGGRKRRVLDAETVERLARIGATHEEIAAVTGVSHDTLTRRFADTPTLADAYARGVAGGKITLRRRQWQGATGGNITMQIWLGKQMLGQRDQIKQEIGGPDGKPLVPVINVTISGPQNGGSGA